MSLPYIKFDFQTREMGLPGPFITIYPVVCMHVGSPQSDMRFIKRHIRRIQEDPTARWVYMGDGGECVTKYSKGDVYGQLLSPQAQQDLITDLLRPIADKGLFGVRGNHGKRIYKETGLDFDKNLMHRLGMPYMGISSFVNMTVNRSSYDMYFHHGIDSGIALASKIKKAEDFMRFINADAVFTAHSHVAVELQPAALLYADNHASRVRVKMRHQYICGSAYDSRTGYAEDKGYPPLLPSYLSVAFDGRIIGGYGQTKQASKVYRSNGDYELNHDYVTEYLAKGNIGG